MKGYNKWSYAPYKPLINDGAKIYIVDENNTMIESITDKVENGQLSIWMKRNSIVYIEKTL